MIAALNIVSLDGETSLPEEIEKVVSVLEDSGLTYRVTPLGTCIEGELEELISVVCSCHASVRQVSPQVVSIVKFRRLSSSEPDSEAEIFPDSISVEDLIKAPFPRKRF